MTLTDVLAASSAAQSLSVNAWAKRSGVHVGTAQFVLAGLGRDLAWLHRQLEA